MNKYIYPDYIFEQNYEMDQSVKTVVRRLYRISRISPQSIRSLTVSPITEVATKFQRLIGKQGAESSLSISIKTDNDDMTENYCKLMIINIQ